MIWEEVAEVCTYVSLFLTFSNFFCYFYLYLDLLFFFFSIINMLSVDGKIQWKAGEGLVSMLKGSTCSIGKAVVTPGTTPHFPLFPAPSPSLLPPFCCSSHTFRQGLISLVNVSSYISIFFFFFSLLLFYFFSYCC